MKPIIILNTNRVIKKYLIFIFQDAFYESQKKYHLDLAKMVQTISGIKQSNPDPSRYPGQGRPGPSGHYNGQMSPGGLSPGILGDPGWLF